MTYVVTERCIACKYINCVKVCPVDCFREGENFLVIEPDECVECGLREVECPVRAIVSIGELNTEQMHNANLNAELAKQWPRISQQKAALPDAERWATVSSKLDHLIR